jgi:Tol biopolymer transport system component
LRPLPLASRAAASLLRRAGIAVPQRRRSIVYAWFPDGRVVTASPVGGFHYQPCVRPDGSQVVYHGGRAGVLRIWRHDFASGETAPLTPADTSAVHPAYSWDGARIAFASDRAWDAPRLTVETLGEPAARPEVALDIFVMGADGAAPQRVTSGRSADRRPCLSPDGASVAFVSDRGGRSDVWLAAVAGGEREPRCLDVAAQGWNPRRPWFGGDGRWLYFYGRRGDDARHRICRVPAAGGAAEALANDPGLQSHGPFVDPDGRTLLVHAKREGPFNIWEVPLDGGAARPLFPPGFPRALHPTRSRTGVVAFDVPSASPDWTALLRGGRTAAAPGRGAWPEGGALE